MIGKPTKIGTFSDQMTAMPVFEGLWQGTVELECCNKTGDKVTGIDKDGHRRVVGIFVEETKCSSM